MMKVASINQEPVEIPKFDFVEFMTDVHSVSLFGWNINVYHWLIWMTIFIFLIFIYNKVFRVQKLTIIKKLIVYIIVAIGAFVLLIFEVDAGLPIVLSLSVAVLLMLIVFIRYFFVERKSKKEEHKS